MAKTICFFSLLFAALSIVPEMAHLLEMPHKMQLTQESYGAVQYIYQGWALLGIVQLGAIIFTGIHLFLVSKGGETFRLILIAFVFLMLPMIIFFVVIFPVNLNTQNWTVLPENWMQLRARWEYAHAANALWATAAYILLLMALLKKPAMQQ